MKNTPDKPALLEVRNLSRKFQAKPGLFASKVPGWTAIDSVNLKIRSAEIYGLVGESGCGKSTLARTILQLTRPDSGQVLLHGQDLCTATGSALRMARQKVQMVFQDPSAALSPRRTVLQTLLEPLQQYGIGTAQDRRDRCISVLETVGLDAPLLSRLPHQLSSGQRQRIGFARAVLAEPELIIADESVSALDVSVQAQILELVKRLQSVHGIAFLFISHDLAVIAQVADHVGVMFGGRIVETGTLESLFQEAAHPYTRELLAAIPDPDPAIPFTPVHASRGLLRRKQQQGCVFAERCAELLPRCRDIAPPAVPLESAPGHRVECHLYTIGKPALD